MNLITRLIIAAFCLTPAVVYADQTISVGALDVSLASQGYGQPHADSTVDGRVLTLKGQSFVHGFGTHAPGDLEIALGGTATRFEAMVGVDDEVGAGRGLVRFELYGDGARIFESRNLSSGDDPQAVDVTLAGIKVVRLHVAVVGPTYDFDHADWADARITMASGQPQAIALADQGPPAVISMAATPDLPAINGPDQVGVWPHTPFLWSVPATGRQPLIFSAHGLPRGLFLDRRTGIVSGNAPAAGDYPVQIHVANGVGRADMHLQIIVGDKAALTPPMGWNSYDAYGDSVTEAEVLANARYVHDHLAPYGWNTVVVDYRWYDPGAHDNNANARAGAALTMDGFGRLLPSPNRFPSAVNGVGFKALADQVHAMGLRFGIHIMRGIPRNAFYGNLPIECSDLHAADAASTDPKDACGWCQDMYGVRGDTPAGQAYYNSILKLYASWGVDFIKMDDTSAPYHTDEIDAVHQAIVQSGRTIEYSLSPGPTDIADGAHVAAHANQWRESGDFWDNWYALDHEFTLGDSWRPWVGPGHWPDADMLPLGHLSLGHRSVDNDRTTRFTKPEQMTLLSLWSLLPSPLMLGASLPDNDPWTLALITNPEVLAINQDSLGFAGTRIAVADESEIWEKNLQDGTKAVGLFNRSSVAQTVTLNAVALGIIGRWNLRDLWHRQDLGPFLGSYSVELPSHGAALIKVSPEPR